MGCLTTNAVSVSLLKGATPEEHKTLTAAVKCPSATFLKHCLTLVHTAELSDLGTSSSFLETTLKGWANSDRISSLKPCSHKQIGGRLGYSIRGTLQSQAKAFVDFQHESRMTKLKAVLDQEKWVEVDVPDEYRAIVVSVFCSESLISGDLDNYSNGLAKGYNEVVPNNNASSPPIDDSVSLSSSQEQVNGIKGKNEHGKPSSHLLFFRGVGYHMVNCGLILLKMLSEYIDMNTVFPALSSEVIRCVLEMLKFFNTRTCQLVLGAGAMQAIAFI